MIAKKTDFFKVKEIILPLSITVVVMIVLFLVGKPIYESNDDMFIIGILSGQWTHAIPNGIYMSIPLSWVLFLLYKLSNNMPWYGMVMYFSQMAGLFLGLRLIFATARGIIEKLLISIGFISIYEIILYRLNFTSTSLFLWYMVALFIAYLNFKGTPARRSDIMLGILLGLSYLIRPDIIMVAVVFTIPILTTLLGIYLK